jgi:hypothetical protein
VGTDDELTFGSVDRLVDPKVDGVLVAAPDPAEENFVVEPQAARSSPAPTTSTMERLCPRITTPL